jgi:hypothetical protein
MTPVTDSPYLGSRSSRRVAAQDRHARRVGHVGSAPQHLAKQLGSELLDRPGRQVERGERARTHRVDVGQRIGSSDPPEVVRIIDDRGEEVDRLDDRESSRKRYTPASSAVGADQQVGIVGLR